MVDTYVRPDKANSPVQGPGLEGRDPIQGPGLGGRDQGLTKPKETTSDKYKSLEAQFNSLTTEIKDVQKQIADVEKELKDDPTNPSLLNQQTTLINTKTNLETKRTAIYEQMQTFIQGPGLGGRDQNLPSSSAPPSTVVKPYQGGFKYNAPMVKSAYLKSPSIQQDFVSAPLTPALNPSIESLWNAAKSAKGTIQPSRLTVAQIRNSAKTKNITLRDRNVYGFRFHYNPTTIAMGWGLNMDASPEYIMGQGTQTAIPLALGGNTASNISMEIALNRIHDMSYIDSSGRISGDPYPRRFKPSTEDARMIYERGTMYDIEYLFRVIFGQDANFNSYYNGMTADKGLMWMVPLQVSLGKGLNYLVRIRNLDLNHVMFNQRMVPIFTTVSLKLERYYDGPNVHDSSDGPTTRNKARSSGGGSTVGGGVVFQ